MTLLGLSGDNDQAIVGYAVGSSYRIFIVRVGIRDEKQVKCADLPVSHIYAGGL